MRTAPNGNKTFVNICEYIVPAKRLNTYPDGIEAVFVDDDREVSNPAYPVYLLDRFSATTGSPARLCTHAPVTQTAPLGQRQYAASLRDFVNDCQ